MPEFIDPRFRENKPKTVSTISGTEPAHRKLHHKLLESAAHWYFYVPVWPKILKRLNQRRPGVPFQAKQYIYLLLKDESADGLEF